MSDLREWARLHILQLIAAEPDRRLRDDWICERLETLHGIRKSLDWVRGELAWLCEMEAVRLVPLGERLVAVLRERGENHLREIAPLIDGVRRPRTEA